MTHLYTNRSNFGMTHYYIPILKFYPINNGQTLKFGHCSVNNHLKAILGYFMAKIVKSLMEIYELLKIKLLFVRSIRHDVIVVPSQQSLKNAKNIFTLRIRI